MLNSLFLFPSLLYSSLNDTETLTVPLRALIDYLPGSMDMLDLKVKQSGLSKLRNYLSSDFEVSLRASGSHQCYEFIGMKAEFGPTYPIQINMGELEYIRGFGCEAGHFTGYAKNKIVAVSRGQCNFEDKALYAQQAGARAIVFLDNQEEGELFRVSGSKKKNKVRIPSVLLGYRDSLTLTRIRHLQQFSMHQLTSVDKDPKAILKLLFRGQIIRNLDVVNV